MIEDRSGEIRVPISGAVHVVSMSGDGRDVVRAEVELSNGMKFTVGARDAAAIANAAQELGVYSLTIVMTPFGASTTEKRSHDEQHSHPDARGAH